MSEKADTSELLELERLGGADLLRAIARKAYCTYEVRNAFSTAAPNFAKRLLTAMKIRSNCPRLERTCRPSSWPMPSRKKQMRQRTMCLRTAGIRILNSNSHMFRTT